MQWNANSCLYQNCWCPDMVDLDFVRVSRVIVLNLVYSKSLTAHLFCAPPHSAVLSQAKKYQRCKGVWFVVALLTLLSTEICHGDLDFHKRITSLCHPIIKHIQKGSAWKLPVMCGKKQQKPAVGGLFGLACMFLYIPACCNFFPSFSKARGWNLTRIKYPYTYNGQTFNRVHCWPCHFEFCNGKHV